MTNSKTARIEIELKNGKKIEARICWKQDSSSVISSEVSSFSSSDDEKSLFIFLWYLLASGYPGCLGVGCFDDVGFLLELDDCLLLSFSAFLEFLKLAGFLLHCEL